METRSLGLARSDREMFSCRSTRSRPSGAPNKFLWKGIGRCELLLAKWEVGDTTEEARAGERENWILGAASVRKAAGGRLGARLIRQGISRRGSASAVQSLQGVRGPGQRTGDALCRARGRGCGEARCARSGIVWRC